MYPSEISNRLIMTNTNSSRIKPWIIWGLASFFYLYENCLQVSPGVMVPELMRTFKVDAAALGNLAAFYFYAYAGTQIPVGVLLDRYGPRRLLTMATAVVAIGCLFFGTAHSVPGAEFGRLLIGFGSAFAAVGCMKLAASWFPLERFALLTGLMLTVGLSGSIFGETPLALLVTGIGWRSSMLILAGIGAVLLAAIWNIMRDKPETMSEQATAVATAEHQQKLFAGISGVLKRPQSWLVAIYGGLMFAPTSIFGALWGVPFLMQAYSLDRPTAAGIISMLFFGWIVGSPLLGLVSDKLGKRKTTMWWGSIGGLACMLTIIYVPNIPTLVLSALLFAFGFFSSGFLPAFSIMREISPHNSNATALGFMNMLNMVGGAAGQPLVGYLLDANWSGEMLDGVRVYSVQHYHIALAALPIMMAISLLIIPFIKETFCKSVTNHQTT